MEHVPARHVMASLSLAASLALVAQPALADDARPADPLEPVGVVAVVSSSDEGVALAQAAAGEDEPSTPGDVADDPQPGEPDEDPDGQDATPDEPDEAPQPIDLSGAMVEVADQSWTGQPLTPEVVVTLDGTTLAADTDYTLSFADNTARGTATVSVTGVGAYAGTAHGSFQIGAPAFTDVTNKTAHDEDIAWTAEQGISEGWLEEDGTRTFRPNASTARGDMAAFLYRLAGSPEFDASSSTVTFADVTTSTAHYKEIMWLAATGISEGWTAADGTRTFRPNASTARGDMAAFLYRLAGSPAVDEIAPLFSDITLSTAHWHEINWLASSGISQGWANADGTRSFRPYSATARGDMAAFLHRQAEARLVAPGTDASANATDGWVRTSSGWRWLDGGEAATGAYEVEDETYLFDGAGEQQTGWHEVDGDWAYFSARTGALVEDAVATPYYYENGNLRYRAELEEASLTSIVTAQAQRVINACKTTPSPGSGLCAAWVTYVFANAGVGTYGGNADQMYDRWCHSTDTAALRPGMIVAVDSYPGGWKAMRYGHVAIYVGNNTVWQNLAGKVGTMSFTDWHNRFDATSQVRWGWLGGKKLA